MLRYLLSRGLHSLITLWLLVTIVFISVRFMGDPAAMVSASGDPAFIQALRVQWGLDQGYLVQYGNYMRNLLHGDFGISFEKGVPVAKVYIERLPHSLILGLAAFSIAIVIGVPLGILSAIHLNRGWDRFGSLFAILGLSFPNFVVGLLLILFFSVTLGWLPSSGAGANLLDLKFLILPAFALGWYFSGNMLRITRSSMLEVVRSDYIKLVRLKGLPEWLVMSKHALTNSLIPIVTLAGLNLVVMVSAAVPVEVIFNWPGVGQLLYGGMIARDFSLVQGIILMTGVMIIGLNFAIDMLYALIDPRIRLAG